MQNMWGTSTNQPYCHGVSCRQVQYVTQCRGSVCHARNPGTIGSSPKSVLVPALLRPQWLVPLAVPRLSSLSEQVPKANERSCRARKTNSRQRRRRRSRRRERKEQASSWRWVIFFLGWGCRRSGRYRHRGLRDATRGSGGQEAIATATRHSASKISAAIFKDSEFKDGRRKDVFSRTCRLFTSFIVFPPLRRVPSALHPCGEYRGL